jgi:copper chaperone CopZ
MKTTIFAVFLFVITFSAYADINNLKYIHKMTQNETLTEQKTVKFKCTEMSCQKCAKSITASVNKLPGIADINVDLDSKIITVTFDDSKTDVQTVLNAIVEAGYEADLIN